MANMKLLIVCTLFTVALADNVRVVTLDSVPVPTYTRPDIRPLVVPQNVLDAIKSHQSVLRSAPFENSPTEVDNVNLSKSAPDSVKIAEAPLPAIEDGLFAVPEAVKIAEAPLPAVEDGVFTIHYGVNIVEAPLPAIDDSAAVPEPVRIAEVPLPAIEVGEFAAPEGVRIAKNSLPAVEDAAFAVPEPVRIAEAPLPAVEDAVISEALKVAQIPLQAIKIAAPAFPRKQYNDPRLR